MAARAPQPGPHPSRRPARAGLDEELVLNQSKSLCQGTGIFDAHYAAQTSATANIIALRPLDWADWPSQDAPADITPKKTKGGFHEQTDHSGSARGYRYVC